MAPDNGSQTIIQQIRSMRAFFTMVLTMLPHPEFTPKRPMAGSKVKVWRGEWGKFG